MPSHCISDRFLSFIDSEPWVYPSFGQKIAQIALDFKGPSPFALLAKKYFESFNLLFSPYCFARSCRALYSSVRENEPKFLILKKTFYVGLDTADVLRAASLCNAVLSSSKLLRCVRTGTGLLGIVRFTLEGIELQKKVTRCYTGWSQFDEAKKRKKMGKIANRSWMLLLGSALSVSAVTGTFLGIALPAAAVNLIALGLMLPKLSKIVIPKPAE